MACGAPLNFYRAASPDSHRAASPGLRKVTGATAELAVYWGFPVGFSSWARRPRRGAITRPFAPSPILVSAVNKVAR